MIMRFLNRIPDIHLLRMRWLGSGCLMIGYFVIIYVNVNVGVVITLISDFLSMPYAYKKKYWDVMMILTFLTVVNVSKLAGLSPN